MQKVKLPFVVRRKYFNDSKQWELCAIFPTIPAESSSWYGMESEAENGDSFSCSHEYYVSSRHCRNWEPSRVSAFIERVKRHWENDSDFPCELVRKERITSDMDAERERDWRKGRAK